MGRLPIMDKKHNDMQGIKTCIEFIEIPLGSIIQKVPHSQGASAPCSPLEEEMPLVPLSDNTNYQFSRSRRLAHISSTWLVNTDIILGKIVSVFTHTTPIGSYSPSSRHTSYPKICECETLMDRSVGNRDSPLIYLSKHLIKNN